MGIERNYDPYLRGVNGVGYVEVDAMGRRRKARCARRASLLGYVTSTEPVPGDNLYLDLGRRSCKPWRQRGNAMKSRGDLHGSGGGARSDAAGEVLALVNDPVL